MPYSLLLSALCGKIHWLYITQYQLVSHNLQDERDFSCCAVIDLAAPANMHILNSSEGVRRQGWFFRGFSHRFACEQSNGLPPVHFCPSQAVASSYVQLFAMAFIVNQFVVVAI